METVFESANIIYVKPTLELVPAYLEMVNDIENVARLLEKVVRDASRKNVTFA